MSRYKRQPGGRGYRNNLDIEERRQHNLQQYNLGVKFDESSYVSELVGLLADAVVHQVHEAIAEIVTRRRVLVLR